MPAYSEITLIPLRPDIFFSLPLSTAFASSLHLTMLTSFLSIPFVYCLSPIKVITFSTRVNFESAHHDFLKADFQNQEATDAHFKIFLSVKISCDWF